jgi:hypothetical protein
MPCGQVIWPSFFAILLSWQQAGPTDYAFLSAAADIVPASALYGLEFCSSYKNTNSKLDIKPSGRLNVPSAVSEAFQFPTLKNQL